MNANTLFPLATIALLAAGIARGALSAPDPEQTYGTIRYACAGVSEESRIDARGFEVFSAHCLSPWVLVDLPPGKYQVEALARQSHTQSFRLTAPAGGQREHANRFVGIVN